MAVKTKPVFASLYLERICFTISLLICRKILREFDLNLTEF